jgi:PAS domain S-box-containing protein
MGLIERFFEAKIRNQPQHRAISQLTSLAEAKLDEIHLISSRLKNAEREARHEAEKYKKLYTMFSAFIDGLPGFVFGRDLEGRFTLTNKLIRDKFMGGLPLDAILGKTAGQINRIIGEKRVDEKEAETTDLQVINFGEHLEYVTSVTVDGEKLILQVFKSPLYDEVGDIVGIVGFSRDITPMCKAKEEAIAHVEEGLKACEKFCESSENMRNLILAAIEIVESCEKISCKETYNDSNR